MDGEADWHRPLRPQPATPGPIVLRPDPGLANCVLRPSAGRLSVAAERQATAHPRYPLLLLPGLPGGAGGRSQVCDGEEGGGVVTSTSHALPKGTSSMSILRSLLARVAERVGGGTISHGEDLRTAGTGMVKGTLKIRRWVRRKLYRWLPPILWMGLMFFSSSRSFLPSPVEPDTVADILFWKTAHIVEYAVLGGLLLRAFNSGSNPAKKEGIWSWAISSLFGLFDEYHQTLIPGREGKLVDVAIDSFGALLGLLLIWRLYRIRARKEAP